MTLFFVIGSDNVSSIVFHADNEFKKGKTDRGRAGTDMIYVM